MNRAEWERHADDVALARYSVISPLVSRLVAFEPEVHDPAHAAFDNPGSEGIPRILNSACRLA